MSQWIKVADLEKLKLEVARLERERIIKLLENERDKYHGSLWAELANEFLAAIKGENK